MNPYIENVQIEEVLNSDYIEDFMEDPYFDEEVFYDDASFDVGIDYSNDF